jgi:putative flavoprotein involved in K+ transport
VVLKPKQLVLATGMSGVPNMPEVSGQESSRATAAFQPAPRPRQVQGQEGRRDRLEQLGPRHLRRAVGNGADVTMVQRSSTHIVKSDTLMDVASARFTPKQAVKNGIDHNKADLIFASLPYAVLPAVRNRSATR